MICHPKIVNRFYYIIASGCNASVSMLKSGQCYYDHYTHACRYLYVGHLGFPTCKKSAEVVVVKWEILLELHSYSDSASISLHNTSTAISKIPKFAIRISYYSHIYFYTVAAARV